MKTRALEWFLGSCTIALLMLLVVFAPMAFAEDYGGCTQQQVADCAHDGKSCYMGECIEDGPCDPWTTAECIAAGKVCVDGECVDNPCDGIECEEGKVCIWGDCVEPEYYTYLDPDTEEQVTVGAAAAVEICFCIASGDPRATPPIPCTCAGQCYQLSPPSVFGRTCAPYKKQIPDPSDPNKIQTIPVCACA